MIVCARLRRGSVSPSSPPKHDCDEPPGEWHFKPRCVAQLPNARALSASIAVYRAQADLFDGKSDGKFVVRWRKS